MADQDHWTRGPDKLHFRTFQIILLGINSRHNFRVFRPALVHFSLTNRARPLIFGPLKRELTELFRNWKVARKVMAGLSKKTTISGFLLFGVFLQHRLKRILPFWTFLKNYLSRIVRLYIIEYRIESLTQLRERAWANTGSFGTLSEICMKRFGKNFMFFPSCSLLVRALIFEPLEWELNEAFMKWSFNGSFVQKTLNFSFYCFLFFCKLNSIGHFQKKVTS